MYVFTNVTKHAKKLFSKKWMLLKQENFCGTTNKILKYCDIYYNFANVSNVL